MIQQASKREQMRAPASAADAHQPYLGRVGIGFPCHYWFICLARCAPASRGRDSDPGTYNSDPPTSGPHYPEEAQAGFYDTNIYQYPAGYLVHNLEHGYIIFWYNCGLLDEATCTDLKSQIKAVMNDFNNVKVVTYLWDSIDVPVVMTSWGRLQKMETFDATQARAFYKNNLNRSPEPNVL